ncbi:3-phosphoshikimate 1-carboxyvinyltransferase [Geoalkalibacter ferrihydriticus]|uniref:3-phosphoshikimate 1-carboxyvinyltransferase n=2 Tax=Geoalkalibacter ferrihydriticus TaxID=392333 RepID=A0A0C2HI07_9BACT|nr:3-phosphoshikimate 1-carboxyvinyltransferase [Geoalkalibacter ferrihydriticus]KIH76621.1 3-phosphoshikimate 1-carboxyvinyltransferase [Geoalkalibacter ferrihydriticus DSM 17813]SDM03904.1 3-phosphoshikimate 1-carboxyvinyltransferase [Geoalkalibacter ferrihydriticus]
MTQSLTLTASGGLRGEITVPGDKSISHRSIMLGSLAEGTTRVHGFLEGEDNLSTLKAFQAMGVDIIRHAGGMLEIQGRGLHGLREPGDVLDCGNSGTTMRLMTGLLAAQRFFTVLTGDQYLRRRPMKRVVEPLSLMGARIWGRDGGERAPLAINGSALQGIEYRSAIASAQVKSALLLAGLYAQGETSVYEPHLSRDHSERMLAFFGADLRTRDGGVTLSPQPRLEGREVQVPGDISSAAFFLVAALIVPGSELLVRNVGINPTRSGVIDILQQMGGDLRLLDERNLSGEPVADILVRGSSLRGIVIGGDLVTRAIDEFPVISVAAALAEGTTLIRDAQELRVKETDRIAAMVKELCVLGARVEGLEDGMRIEGVADLQGGRVGSHGDHRIAMSMAVAALRARAPVTIEDIGCTATSFPNFWQLLEQVRK